MLHAHRSVFVFSIHGGTIEPMFFRGARIDMARKLKSLKETKKVKNFRLAIYEIKRNIAVKHKMVKNNFMTKQRHFYKEEFL